MGRLACIQGMLCIIECRLSRRDLHGVDVIDLRDDAGFLLWSGMLQLILQ